MWQGHNNAGELILKNPSATVMLRVSPKILLIRRSLIPYATLSANPTAYSSYISAIFFQVIALSAGLTFSVSQFLPHVPAFGFYVSLVETWTSEALSKCLCLLHLAIWLVFLVVQVLSRVHCVVML